VPPRRGEVWLFDCGMVAKVRPVLVLSISLCRWPTASLLPLCSHDEALPVRKLEIKYKSVLKEGAFVAQSSPLIQPFARSQNSAR